MSYVYYSYEEWGRGYIGVRKRNSEGDDSYFGSFADKTFKPTHKIVLAEFDTWTEALQAEIDLHAFYDVAHNPYFANISASVSIGFSMTGATRRKESNQLIADSWTDERKAEQGKRTAALNKNPEFKARQYSINMRNRRSHWTEDVWNEVAAAVESSKGKFHWGKQDLIDRLGVSEKTLRKMRKLVLQGLTYKEATG